MLTDLVKQLAKERGYRVKEVKAEDFEGIARFGNFVIVNQYYEKAGDTHHGHEHNFDHITYVHQGSVLVEKEGFEPHILKAPAVDFIVAGVHHEIIALEDDSRAWCISVIRDAETSEIAEPRGMWEKKLTSF